PDTLRHGQNGISARLLASFERPPVRGAAADAEAASRPAGWLVCVGGEIRAGGGVRVAAGRPQAGLYPVGHVHRVSRAGIDPPERVPRGGATGARLVRRRETTATG